MRKIVIFLLLFLILIVIAYGAIFVFINTEGRNIIREKVKNSLGVEPHIGAVSFAPPFKIRIEDFKCADISFSRADIHLGFPKYPAPFLNFKSLYLYGLNFKIKYKEDKFTFSPFTVYKKDVDECLNCRAEFISSAWANPIRASLSIPPFAVKYLYLKNASGELIDLDREKPVKFIFKDINGELRDLIYPKLTKFYMKLKASLEVNKISMKDAVSINGWVDYFSKDMDISLVLNNLDYSAFSSYYPSSFKPHNLEIKEAYLSLRSNLKSQNNELVIDNVLSLERIKFIETDEEESISKINSIKTILSLFKKDSGKAEIKFRLTTKMDSPQIDFSPFKESFSKVFRLTPAALVGRAIDKVKGGIFKVKKKVSKGVKGAKEVAVDNTVETIKSILDAIKTIIKSSDNSTPQE